MRKLKFMNNKLNFKNKNSNKRKMKKPFLFRNLKKANLNKIRN